MTRTRWTYCAIAVLVGAPITVACGQQGRASSTGTVVLAIPGDATVPVPIVGPQFTHVMDVADQMFLRLGFLKSSFRTAGDDALTPMLARSWKRLGPTALAFELDPRARWHDGTPVTTRDVLFTWRLMNHPRVGADRASIEPIEAVDSTGVRTFTIRFRRPFAEQLYLAAFNMQPLPAHLLATMAPDSIASSVFGREPVGNGPFRFARRVAGEFTELRSDSAFFLGRPTITRVVFRVVGNPATRLNMLLSGELDVLELLPPAAVPQVRAKPDLRVATFMSNMVVYGRFNLRSPSDSARPHPILADRAVRAALVMALDRRTMAAAVFGPNALTPDAAQSVAWGWVARPVSAVGAQPRARVQEAFAAAGWRDTDGDGILDHSGEPLRIRLLYPETSPTRVDFALQLQAMWRASGVDAVLDRVGGPVYGERRSTGRFDVDVTAVNQDASPMSLAQSWSCASMREARSSNNARWCDPEFDRLLAAAATSRNPGAGYRAALQRMAHEAPAAFLAAPYNNVGLHSRFENVQIWPVKQWSSLWQWRVRRGAELPRDR